MKKGDSNGFRKAVTTAQAAWAALVISVMALVFAGCDQGIAGLTTPKLTGTVTIDGEAQVGSTLKADTSELGGTGTIAYLWLKGTEESGEYDETEVSGDTYTLEAGDRDLQFKVRVERSGYSGTVESDPTDPVTVPAVQKYAVTIDEEMENGTVNSDKETAAADETVTLTVNAEAGYRYKAATIRVAKSDGDVTVSTVYGSATQFTFTMPAEAVTVTAEFEDVPSNERSISIDPGVSHGSVASSVTSALAGTEVTLTVTANEGYRYKDNTLTVSYGEGQTATLTPDGDNKHKFTMPQANVTVSAEFEAINYTVTAAETQHGSISINPESAIIGTTITVTVTPDTGYKLKSIKYNTDNDLTKSGEAYTFQMPAANVTVTAQFEAIPYSISITVTADGTVKAAVGETEATSATVGQQVTLTVTPDAGHRLKAGSLSVKKGEESVSFTGNDSGPFTFQMPAANVTVTAEFEAAGGSNGGQTANITFVKTENNSSATVPPTDDAHLGSYDAEGAEQAWTISVVEEPYVYFAVNKTEGQSINTSGSEAGKVTRAASIGTMLDGSTESSTLAVFRVDMEDLLFDGAFTGGKETRTFILNVEESGKTGIAVTVNINITQDEDASVSIYKKNDGRWEKVRDPEIDKTQANYIETLTEGPVTDLHNALAWVDQNAESGTGESDEQNGITDFSQTKKNYSRYRILVKEDQQTYGINFKFLGRDYVSLELYGAGNIGKEKNIALNDNCNNIVEVINYSTAFTSKGFITIGANYKSKDGVNGKKILILEKNITINGGKEKNPFNTDNNAAWYKISRRHLIAVEENSTFIMKPHSKITGYYTTSASVYFSPILISNDSDNSILIDGGSITNNKNNNGSFAYLDTTGTSISFICNNGYIKYNKNVNDVEINKIENGNKVQLWPK